MWIKNRSMRAFWSVALLLRSVALPCSSAQIALSAGPGSGQPPLALRHTGKSIKCQSPNPSLLRMSSAQQAASTKDTPLSWGSKTQ